MVLILVILNFSLLKEPKRKGFQDTQAQYYNKKFTKGKLEIRKNRKNIIEKSHMILGR